MSEPPPPQHPYLPGEPIPADARPYSEADDPTGILIPANPRAEALVAGLLALSGLLGAGFAVAYVLVDSTPVYGMTLGGALLALAAALIVAGKRVVPQETVIEPRAPLEHPHEEAATAELLASAGSGVSRGRLLKLTAALAGAGLSTGSVAALASFGPWIGRRSVTSPWRRGRTLVDQYGRPIRADDLEVGSFATAFPQGVNTDLLGSSVIVVRIAPALVDLPAGRRKWAVGGIMAYSKICTHAGCAVAMMRYPLYAAHTAGPALVCPCHYSTFDVATGGTVVFGPAGRPLPQLPIAIAADGTLQAAGPLSGDVGPAWFGVDRG
jgi:ubiquinol-cytochrome c reductase iron-sulfur subunit